ALGIGIIITGKAIVYAADVTAKAIITAAQKAAEAAKYAAAQIRNVFASVNSAAGKVSAASQVAAISPTLLNLSSPPATTPAKTTSTIVSTAPHPPAPPPIPPPPAPPPIKPQISAPPVFGPALVSVSPGFGGGGAAPSPVVAAPVSVISVPLTVQAPLEGALFATSSVTFSGTTNPGYSVVASYASVAAATAANAGGNWSITLTLPEGATSIGVVATDSAGNTSDAVTRTVVVNTTPPGAPSASISECAASLSTQFCLIPTTSATLAWPPVAGTAYYAYALNSGIMATTTATSVALSLTANASSTLSVAAYDAAGNAATSTLNIYVMTQPLIINEIAWSGTQAEANDEWIELKNNSLYALTLSRSALVSADGSPSYIQLSGAIAPGGFYLIERREGATSVAGDTILAFDGLSNDG
ncbi:MAG: hypothetical protein AAB899_03030, partial [Patescibacteria group bacterium]